MANAQQIPLHMREVSRTGFVQRLRRYPSHHIHRGKLDVQSATFHYHDEESNNFQVVSNSGDIWHSGALNEGIAMISFVLQFAVISVLEITGNLDLNAEDLKLISTSPTVFLINSIRIKANKMGMSILYKTSRELLTEISLGNDQTAIQFQTILEIPFPNVRNWAFDWVSHPEGINDLAKVWMESTPPPETQMFIKTRGNSDWMLDFKTAFFAKIREEAQDRIAIELDADGMALELSLLDKNTFELSVVKVSRHLDPHFRDEEFRDEDEE
ncbi:hypothetical protein B9Z55_008159 [Caenorhabditis nigoni]|uniref:Uncharacterized protein n=1 Tax=Caenorhabditis nigoni TaxID=1611254 RepID=A0A2G5VCY9_9PELO|nr:hypothetical protein B9Z55_008159 [Caenorhabditis nigoni]